MKLLTYCENFILSDEYKANLESKGISRHIQKEEFGIGAFSGGGQPLITIFVEEENYQAAMELMKNLNLNRNSNLPWCPECGSENVTHQTITHRHGSTWMLFIGIVSFIACIILTISSGFTILFIPTVIPIALLLVWFKSYKEDIYHCNQCRKDFKRI